jgi:phospholipid/cholesterol/gamma-HCH transport system permease protein
LLGKTRQGLLMETESIQSELTFSRPNDATLLIRLAGPWTIGHGLPPGEDVQKQLGSGQGVKGVSFDAVNLQAWDSSLLTFLTRVVHQCSQHGIQVDRAGLPEGVQRLLALAEAVPEKKDARKEAVRESSLSRIGESAIAFGRSAGEMLDFIGEASVAFLRLLIGKASFRRSDLTLTLQEAGAQALPIVSLISFLVGLILAFVGAVQLRMFGAQIYVASLVGIAMVRIMGAIMTGIIMAGRTGAAFAAELGTMQVNEEIDALKTLGLSPMEFLVLPRMLALTLMMPLLCLYADLMGILGGLVVGVSMLDLNLMEYFNQTKASVGLNNLWIGLFHSAVFGVLVALAGCLRGIQCGRSATAVGKATTSAVVTGIVSIIVATGIITVICDVLGI